MSTLRILPLSSRQKIDDVKALSDGSIIACDFYIDKIETVGQQIVGGFQIDNVINIDHHAPVPQMRRQVSSTNLAIEFVNANGIADAGTIVVVNHGDCDSVLSAGIMLGRVEPSAEVGAAAIAADHTGDANDIADMLQGLDDPSTKTATEQIRLDRFEFALRNVNRLLAGEPLDDVAERARMDYRSRRSLAVELVAANAFLQEAGLASGIAPSNIDGSFLPVLLPEAAVILLATPVEGDSARWKMKARLGNAAPAGLTLFDLKLEEFDMGWGGRWNAGSNSRAGGCTVEPCVYAQEVQARLERALKARETANVG